MKKNFLIIACMTVFVSADFMDSIGDMVKSTLSDDDDKSVVQTKSVGTKITDNFPKDKVESLMDDMVDGVKSTIGIKEKKKKKKKSLLKKSIIAVKEVAGLKKIKQDNSFFDGGIMGEMADIIDLEKGETFGLPSIFGINKKKQKKVFGSTVLADTLLGDVKNTGTGFYKGFKNTGESAEFMSGMMYKSSKIYNGMFHVFDDSVFNIFDDDESSVFDVFEEGNEVLDIFD
jgi:hypothetical protein